MLLRYMYYVYIGCRAFSNRGIGAVVAKGRARFCLKEKYDILKDVKTGYLKNPIINNSRMDIWPIRIYRIL